MFKTWHFVYSTRSATRSVSCNTGRGHCLLMLFLFSKIAAIIPNKERATGSQLSMQRSKNLSPRELKWGSSRVCLCDHQCVTLETILFSVPCLVWEGGKKSSRADNARVCSGRGGDIGIDPSFPWWLPKQWSNGGDACTVSIKLSILETWVYKPQLCPQLRACWLASGTTGSSWSDS